MRVCVAFWTVLLSIVVSVTGALAQTKQASPASTATVDAAKPPAAAQARATTSKTTGTESATTPATPSTSSTSGPATGAPATSASGSDIASPAPATSAALPVAPSAVPQSGTAGSAAAPAASRPIDGATFAVRLRDLEQRIDELKEQIRRSHTRLSLLSDTILSGGVGGARSEIEFQNDMSDAFRITKVIVVLDGAVLYNKADESGALAEQEKIPIFSGSIPPGDHTVQVKVELRGHGYGVFSYLRGYSFKVENSHSFTVTEGKTSELKVIAYEKGGITTPLEQRPNVRFVETVTASVRATRGKASAARKATASPAARAGGQ